MYQDELYSSPANTVEEPKLTEDSDLLLDEPDQIEMSEELEEVEEITIGIVSNCNNLNVREMPRKDATIVCEVACQTELMIALNESTEDFYKVCTAAGIEGFCMKQFITIQP